MASVRYINRTLSHDCASKYDLKVIFFLFQIQPAIVESNLTTSLPTFFLQAMDIQEIKNRLHLAAKEGNLFSVKAMIHHSNLCDNNHWWKDELGMTPFHLAAQEGHFEICQFFLQNVKDKNPKDNAQDTPLHIAALRGDHRLFKLISKEVVDINPPNNNLTTPLHLAAQHGHLKICKRILKKISDKEPKDNFGQTPLHFAAEHGHLEICQRILDNVEDKNPSANNGKTPLHLAAQNGHLPVVCLIIENPINMHPKDSEGTTPFHVAVRKGNLHLEICQKIVEKAKENNPDKDGVTPMHLAAKKGCIGIYKLILQNVEEKNPEDNQGKTPIEWAGGHTQILRAYSQFS